ncbi:MAG: hypothetical protein ACT4ON_15945 [Bacteroidota bacterium]
MEHLTLSNILLLFCGITIKFLYAVKKQQRQGKPFLIGFFLKDNLIEIALTLVAGFASLIMSDDMIKLLGVQAADGSPFYSAHAFISGIAPLFVIGKIMKLVKINIHE